MEQNGLGTIKYVLVLLTMTTFFSTHQSFAQCNPLGNTKGTIHDQANTVSIDYKVSFSATCSMRNFGRRSECGIDFPDISAVWSGNTNDSISTITYTFSKSIYSIDIIIGLTGINGSVVLETFLFTTDGPKPRVSVYSGTCPAWSINGNETTSPSIAQGLNSIHTISSEEGFTTLTITTDSSGVGEDANGGSNFAICDGSVIIEIPAGSESEKRAAGIK